MRISDWSSDVCSSDLEQLVDFHGMSPLAGARTVGRYRSRRSVARDRIGCWTPRISTATGRDKVSSGSPSQITTSASFPGRSEEHTSELQSLIRISNAVFCFKKQIEKEQQNNTK